jgi:hypothetical protein
LGFYRRARYLHEGAKYAVEKFKNGEGEVRMVKRQNGGVCSR